MSNIDLSTISQTSVPMLRIDLDLANSARGSHKDEHANTVNNKTGDSHSRDGTGVISDFKSTGADKRVESVEQKVIDELEKRDREVRAHELAHQVVAGSLAQGGPSFKLERGPNGKFFAVSGSVSLDVSKESSPEETVAKMQTIRKAALAPANPSAKDRSVAADAAAKEAEARRELIQEEAEEVEDLNNVTNVKNTFEGVKIGTAGEGSNTSGSPEVTKLAGGTIDTFV